VFAAVTKSSRPSAPWAAIQPSAASKRRLETPFARVFGDVKSRQHPHRDTQIANLAEARIDDAERPGFLRSALGDADEALRVAAAGEQLTTPVR
jgi:hypothetical protein